MRLEELYSKRITREVNPAVSATKFDAQTKTVEIEEYVFTDEIIKGLYRILSAIKNNQPFEHVGIWIDGYYGSGKSHFLKYLDYCITPDTREKALERLLEAVKEIDPFDDRHDIGCDYQQMHDIATWLQRATIDTCIFNLETSYDNSTDKRSAFLHIFWNEFNGKRGFNKFNLTLAQNLEKPLQEKGVFEQFKQKIAELGGDWNDAGMAADMIDQELGTVLDIACEVAPTLDKESIRQRIINRDTNISIDRFGLELAAYLKDKGPDYRLIFLADEVSQFINKEKDRYLNLQEIITKLSEACQNKVWVACTAQQDLSEILDDCHIAEEKDKEGKIMGRFEVKVSLKGTRPEVITQKRILDKKTEVVPMLQRIYDQQKAAFGLQFKLPSAYTAYESCDDFVAFYPFVPYQFKLIMKVFDSFLGLGYVAKEVKGNERSIIKVVHSTAKACAQAEVGRFVSFDELYNSMFEEGLQARGQKAVKNAEDMAARYERDPRLAKRIAHVLFMICNIQQTDQLQFPANIDNVTTLITNDTQTPRLNIKREVEKVVEFFCDENIIRREQGKNGAPDTFSFYSEEEMKVAQLIQSQTADNNTQAEQLKEIFFKYLSSLKNKEQYLTRSFAVGAIIKQRHFLSNAPDVDVEFAMDVEYDSPDQLALRNVPNKMIYYVGPQFLDNKRLRNAFYWYCQVSRYMATPPSSEDNAKTRKEFEKRAKELYDAVIAPEFHKILDSCPVISGVRIVDEVELGSSRGAERFRTALQKHLASIYTKAKLVDSPTMPRNSDALKRAILRPVQPGEYEGMNADPTPAEHEVEIYLSRQFQDVNVADIVAKFAKAPYGWDSICTLYVVNELVRRHRRDYSLSNNPNVEVNVVASRLLSETNKFSVREAKVISADLINQFVAAWKDIFGQTESFPTTDSTQLFRLCREEVGKDSLQTKRRGYQETRDLTGEYPFSAPIKEGIALFDRWLAERDPQKFFQLVIDDRQRARNLVDKCKEVAQFTHDQLDKYKDLRRFARDNQYNFPFITGDGQAKVYEFQKIETDEWPIRGFRTYLMLQKELRVILDEVRRDFREKIRQQYSDIFDYLEKVAREQNVPTSVLASRDNTILSKTAPDNILVLQGNVSTDAFYQEQIARILDYAEQHKPKTDDTQPGDDDQPKRKRVCQASLSTKTKVPITNTEDIDRYLDGLREQLTKLLVNYDSIMIVK